MSECWEFYAVSTARVIFTAKTSLEVFSLRGEQVWTFSVLGDRMYEMRCPFVAVGLNAPFMLVLICSKSPEWSLQPYSPIPTWSFLTWPIAFFILIGSAPKSPSGFGHLGTPTTKRAKRMVLYCGIMLGEHALSFAMISSRGCAIETSPGD